MKRAVCIWLPNWPLQRLAAARAELRSRAVVLYERHATRGARVVSYAAPLAQAAAGPWLVEARHTAGIRPDMPLAEATAIVSIVPILVTVGAVNLMGADPLLARIE